MPNNRATILLRRELKLGYLLTVLAHWSLHWWFTFWSKGQKYLSPHIICNHTWYALPYSLHIIALSFWVNVHCQFCCFIFGIKWFIPLLQMKLDGLKAQIAAVSTRALEKRCMRVHCTCTCVIFRTNFTFDCCQVLFWEQTLLCQFWQFISHCLHLCAWCFYVLRFNLKKHLVLQLCDSLPLYDWLPMQSNGPCTSASSSNRLPC